MIVPENIGPSKADLSIEDPPQKTKSAGFSKTSKTPKVFAHRFRYLVLFLGCLCLTSICSNMISLNFTFICMVREVPEDAVSPSGNLTHAKPQNYYNQHQKSTLIWAIAISSLLATFPFTVAYAKFGARYVLLAAGLLSAFATLLVPLAVEQGFYYFVVLRIFQGISYAAVFAAIGVLCSRWASLKQNGIFISVLTCFSSLASSITNPVAGAVSYFRQEKFLLGNSNHKQLNCSSKTPANSLIAIFDFCTSF